VHEKNSPDSNPSQSIGYEKNNDDEVMSDDGEFPESDPEDDGEMI
jgi:hypothetical protein